MILGILLLLAGLTISAVAIYYSVLGLAAIFAAATMPIYVMGGVLEVSKLIAASWLKANWHRASYFIKWYMLSAVAILMLITSMGIFGFLSKAHLDQSAVNGNTEIKISEIDRQIAIEQRSINDATKVIAQLDQAVQTLTDSQRIRGADGAIAVRRSQIQERNDLNNLINRANNRISELEQVKLPMVQQRLAIEAEVGPIKYIAAFVYGSDTTKDILERAVTWVIILLVIVFDPLAIAMLLAAQMTFDWYRKDNKKAHSTASLDNGNVTDNNTVDDIEDNKLDPILEDSFDNIEQEQKIDQQSTETDAQENLTITTDTTVITTDDPKYQIFPEESLKKKIYDQEHGQSNHSGETVTYVQNSEQKEDSLWKFVRSEEFKSKDYLRFVYAKNKFDDFQYDTDLEPELDKFIKNIKTGTHSFSDYSTDELEYFANKLYELRKNQPNYTA